MTTKAKTHDISCTSPWKQKLKKTENKKKALAVFVRSPREADKRSSSGYLAGTTTIHLQVSSVDFHLLRSA